MKKIFFLCMVAIVFVVMLLVSENKYFIDTDLEPDNSILMLLSGVLVVMMAALISGKATMTVARVALLATYVLALYCMFGAVATIVGFICSTILAVYIMANDDIKSWIESIWKPEKNEKA